LKEAVPLRAAHGGFMTFVRTVRPLALACALLGTGLIAPPAGAFDIEDYAGTSRATRDALKKSMNELRLAHGAWIEISTHAALHGIDVRDEAWLLPPMVLSGSCESAPDVAFAKNVTGPELGRAYGNFIRTMVDVLSPDAFQAVLRDPEDAQTYYRQARDAYRKQMLEAVVALPPIPGLPNQCADQVYYGDIEDLMGTLRARRDAYLKAANQYTLALPPYKAALAAYLAVTRVYGHGIACDPGINTGALPAPEVAQ
jgi:hypothetical protein